MRNTIIAVRLIVGAAMLLDFTASAYAQDIEGGLRRLDDAAQLDLAVGGITALTAAQPDQVWKVASSVGLAHTRLQGGGRLTFTPYALGLSWRQWSFEISGDGFMRVSAGGETLTGFRDITFLVAYKSALAPTTFLTGAAAITAPTHDDVGSSSWSQDGRILITHGISDQWTISGAGVLFHSNKSIPGISQFTKVGQAKVSHTIPDFGRVSAAIQRAQTSGGGGASKVLLGYNIPLQTRLKTVNLTLGQGITAGSRSTSLRADFTF